MGRQRLAPGERTITEQIRFQESVRKDLHRHAKRLGTSRAGIIRDATLNWVGKANAKFGKPKKKKPRPKAPKYRAIVKINVAKKRKKK